MFVIVLLRNVNYGRSENSESQVTRRILKQKKKRLGVLYKGKDLETCGRMIRNATCLR